MLVNLSSCTTENKKLSEKITKLEKGMMAPGSQLDKARESYQEFLAKYPTHEFADDARAMLKNLGKTPEELVKEFEAKNAAKDSL